MTKTKEEIRVDLILKAREILKDKGLEFLTARKLAEYNASIEPTIKEAADASNVVSALRTNRLSATVLAIANSIINK